MNVFDFNQSIQSRRQFLNRTGMGLGATVLGSICHNKGTAGESLVPHFSPKAKRVIFLFMAGAPSQLDLFDYKPDLH